MIAIIININKFNKYFDYETHTFVCNDLNECYEKLINTLVSVFINTDIDYPDDLIDFDYLWFNRQYVKIPSFYYKIFSNNIWDNPWENQEIYSDILDKINQIETSNPPNFSKLYGEPDLVEDPIQFTNDSKKENKYNKNEQKCIDEISDEENSDIDINEPSLIPRRNSFYNDNEESKFYNDLSKKSNYINELEEKYKEIIKNTINN